MINSVYVSIGSIIADILVILILFISIFKGYKRGLTMLIVNFACLIITMIAVLILYKPITNWVYDNTNIDEYFSERIENTIGNFLDEKLDTNELIDASQTNISESIVKKINEYIIEAKEKSIDNISGYVANQLSYIVVSAIVVITLSITIRLATFLLKRILILLTNLPIIKTIDKSGGAVYGVIRGYIIIYTILAILSLLSPMLADTEIIAWIKTSKVCSIFYNNNIFLKILG